MGCFYIGKLHSARQDSHAVVLHLPHCSIYNIVPDMILIYIKQYYLSPAGELTWATDHS